METIKFKSFDDCAKYISNNNVYKSKDNYVYNKKDNKNNTIAKSALNSSTLYNRYKELTEKEKHEFLRQLGVKLFIPAIYNSYDKRLYTDEINPFTKKKMNFLYSGKKKLSLKNEEKVFIKLKPKKRPSNINDLYSIEIFRGANIFKKGDNPQLIKNNQYEDIIEGATWGAVDSIDSNRKILFDDFVTLTDANSCTKNNHNIEDIDALIFILRKDGRIMPRTLPAHYCKTCNKYYITRWQFEQICDLGILMCQMITENGSKHNSSSHYYDNLQEESILYRSGYNVKAKDDLSAKQRQMIIAMVIESGMCNNNQISSHLTWLINNWRDNQSMQNAIQKWTEDRDFVINYRKGTHRAVGVKLIRHKR